MIFNKNKDCNIDKTDFDSIILKNHKNCKYELILNALPKKLNNLYLWNYIQRDVISAFNNDFFINVEINDKEHSEIFRSYLSDLYDFIKIDDNKSLICCKKADNRIITELIESTSILQYTNIIRILFFINEINHLDMNYYNDMLKEYAISMEPCGDNLGFYIYINKSYISEDALILKIKNVLSTYKMQLNII